jgi:hypothetical protein
VYDEDSPRSFTMAQLEDGLHMEPTSATPRVSQFDDEFFLQMGSLQSPTSFNLSTLWAVFALHAKMWRCEFQFSSFLRDREIGFGLFLSHFKTTSSFHFGFRNRLSSFLLSDGLIRDFHSLSRAETKTTE